MPRQQQRLIPGTQAQGFPTLLVYVEEVNKATNIAVVVDHFGKRHTIRVDYRRGKGPLPAVGEQWIIDRSHGNWTFASAVVTILPEITGDVAGNVALDGLLTQLDGAGLIKKSTTNTGGGGGGSHTHDDVGPSTTVVGGVDEAGVSKARAGDFSTTIGDDATSDYANVVIGRGAFAGAPGDNLFYDNIVIGAADDYDMANGFNAKLVNGPAGYGASEVILQGWDSWVSDAFQVVSIGTRNRVVQGRNDILIGFESWIGYDGSSYWGGDYQPSGGHNIMLSTDGSDTGFGRYAPPGWMGESSHLILIGSSPYVDAPWWFGGASDASDLPSASTGIINISNSDYAWGEGIIHIANPGGVFSFGDSVGTRLVNIGFDVYIDRFTYDGAHLPHYIFHPVDTAVGIGNEVYPQGDESFALGFNTGTARATHMILSPSGGSIEFSGILEMYVAEITAEELAYSYVFTSEEFVSSLVNMDTTAHSVTCTLLQIHRSHSELSDASDTGPDYGYYAGREEGTILIIRKNDSSANTITINPTSPDTIDGASTMVLTNQYDYVRLVATIGMRGTYPSQVFTPMWAVLDGRIGGVPIGGSGGGGGGAVEEIPIVHGVPGYTPTPSAGMVASAYDADNDVFYVYNGSWKGVVLA